jgi:hypothetical protein
VNCCFLEKGDSEMSTTVVILLLVLIIIAVVGIFYYYRRQRTEGLHSRFGPEYDRTVTQFGNRYKAEAELERRAKRVEKFHIHDISAGEKHRFSEDWQTVQSRFVDQPEQAVAEAHKLVSELMRARGYPASAEFEQNADDLSVDHPHVVEHYRTACVIAGRRENEQVNTEDLRAAMVHYRELFEDLLGRSLKESEEVRR